MACHHRFPLWLLFTVVLLRNFRNTNANAQSKTAHPTHLTHIACEGDTLNISCPIDKEIIIIRANYGRFSLLECNERSETWENVECMYAKSTRVMQERCQYKQVCYVPADDSTFGDECPGTFKYLEVTYECKPRVTTKPTMATTLALSKSTSAPVFSQGADSQRSIAITKPNKGGKATTPANMRIQPSHLTGQVLLCAETIRRGLQWPATKVNNSAKIKCPNNQEEHMYAEWQCSADAIWTSDYPDLSRCISTWAIELEFKSRSIRDQENAKAIAADLHAKISKSRLYGGDINICAKILQRLSKYASDGWVDKISFIKEITQELIQISSDLLKDEYHESWMDLPNFDRTLAANTLLLALENVGVMAAQMLDNATATIRITSSANIGMEITTITDIDQDYAQFPSKLFSPDQCDHIRLPRSLLQAVSASPENPSKIIIIFHDKALGQYLSSNPISLLDTETTSDRAKYRYIASRLFSATILQYDHDTRRHKMAKFEKLRDPILITLGIEKSIGNISRPICVYWDSANRWSSNGCNLKNSNSTHAICACDHLTTFAVLMDVYGIIHEPEHHLVLIMITYFGCIVSIISCALAILAFCFFRIANQCDRITIHKNLCLCLLIAESIFVIGIDWIDWPMACTLIAVSLHYAFLCAFAWMLLEGVELYALLIEVFQSERNRKPYFYLFGYGIPLIIVGISLLIDYESYGTQKHCWLKTENYFVYSFVGPVMVVLAANFVFLIMALIVMCRHTNYSSSYRRDSERRSFMDNVRLWWKGALILVLLLGLTWALGILYIIHPTLVSAYAFTVLNSLQGLFILIFHVVLNPQMRKEMHARFLKWRGIKSASWLRTPSGSGEYKAAKIGAQEEPMSILSKDLNGIGTGHSNVFGSIFRSFKLQNNKRGSVLPLASSTSGQSSRIARDRRYERTGGMHSESVDTAMLSDTMTDMSEYATTYDLTRAPPNFSPPSPPLSSPIQRRSHNLDLLTTHS